MTVCGNHTAINETNQLKDIPRLVQYYVCNSHNTPVGRKVRRYLPSVFADIG